jgi:hypothetical protein
LGNNGATSDNRNGQTAYITAENLGVKVTVVADKDSDYSAIYLSAVEDARNRGFPLKVEVLPKPIMLNMAIRGESDKHKCSAMEMLMPAVTIITPPGPLCMRGVRQIIVEEDMDHLLIGRPVLDEMSIVASSIWTLYRTNSTCTTSATYWRIAIGDGQAAFGRPVKSFSHARGHSRVYLGLAGCANTGKEKNHEASGAGEAERA